MNSKSFAGYDACRYIYPMKTGFWLCLAAWLFCGCVSHTEDETKTRVSVSVYGAQNQILYLMTVPAEGEQRQVLDSATVMSVKDSLVFFVPRSKEAAYVLEMKPSYHKFYLIPDTSYIRIRADDITGKYTAEGSPGSASLVRFRNRQALTEKHIRQLYDQIQKTRANANNARGSDTLQARIADSIASVKQFARRFADTTTSAGVFLQVYDAIDFGDDYRQALAFVSNAAERFPGSRQIGALKTDLTETASIYEEELQVGDSLPAIQLPDAAGNAFSTASLRGRYYFIDFWSTWCTSCLAYEAGKIAVRDALGDHLAMVSVALDDNAYDWQSLIRSRRLSWTQLIDEKMWRGAAARTLKFDSIPFNFLVSPQGRILAKAIPPDSLLPVIKKVINQ